MNNTETDDIAIIGLTGRFPQAINLDAFWTLLKNGREAVVEFSDEKLLATGIDPTLLQHPDYVKSGTVVPKIADFDADFFDMSARDAEITDPQQRLFMECAWQVLEQAGYPPATTDASIGVYAGVGDNSYLSHCLEPNFDTLLPTVGAYRLFTISGKDFIATRTAYKLNLTGPAMTVQTACSTSLVAVHVACQSLLNMECDMVLAGAASIAVPQEQGYLYQEGMIRSPDGHCRAFDAQAQGTTGGGGVGVVLLKRLDEALVDGDTIHAVIRGSAINNDGADKMGYTAPSVGGQSDVISEAQNVADVHPDDISYIEAHGTGTPLGDPIEIQALTQAFRANTQRKGYCAIGSVKTNIGHADTAAGIAGLIKTVLALKHRKLPPSLHYEHPNPQIDFANSPFFVNNQLVDWKTDEAIPRCAGVSSFGIGGTNAHLIVEEAPAIEPSGSSRPLQLITQSAKTPTALDTASHNLSDWLQSHREVALADVAYTLNQGRQSFAYRRSLVCSDIDDALQQLANPAGLVASKASEKAPAVVFLFPGQGSQYLNMTQNLYATESVFKNALDECITLLTPSLGLNLRDLLYSDNEQHHATLKQTAYTQPALFVVEYALAKLWMAYGVQPTAMLGHSIGEYVAACLAGVFSLEDALVLVAIRGKLIQSLPSGAMLAVPLSEEEIQPWITTEVSLAVVNGLKRCVVSGTHQAMATLQQALQAQGIESRFLQTSHAFHSHLLEPILTRFSQRLRQIKLHQPKIPYLSNLTGDWIRSEQATDAQYWVSHLRHTVRFADNVQALFKHQTDILLEVGPGQTLLTMVRQHPEYSGAALLASLPRQRHTESKAEVTQVLQTLGQLWSNGVSINWQAFYAEEKRHRLPLPTYPFERKRYWIDSPRNHRQAESLPITPKESAIVHSSSDLLKTYVAPRNRLEQTIADILSKALGIESISLYDNFFDLGGDSLLAVQVIAKLRETMQMDLDAHSLLNNSTTIALAGLIGEKNLKSPNQPILQTLPSCLVTIQTGNTLTPPLFLMHPAGGHVYFYRDMVEQLGAEQPVYGLQAQGVDGKTEPQTQVEEMATHYLKAVRILQPEGPYFLGGSSFGGTLAFEMAQQLHALGQKVALLAMMDTPGLGYMPVELNDDAEILAYLLELGYDISLPLAELRQLGPDEQLDYCIKQIKTTNKKFFDLDLTHFRTVLKLFKTNSKAMFDYIPSTYPGKILFFRAKERDAFLPHNPELAWIDLALEGTEVHIVPGNHISMNRQPHIPLLAKRLKICLEKADYCEKL